MDIYLLTFIPGVLKTGYAKKNAFFYSSGNLKQQKLNLNVSNIHQIKAN